MKRREFMVGSAAAAGSFAIVQSAGKLWAQPARRANLDRIAIMSRSFNPILKNINPADPSLTLEILDLPGMIAERYGVHFVEFQHTDFESTEPDYLAEFKSRMQKANSRINQINLEFRQLNISMPTRCCALKPST